MRATVFLAFGLVIFGCSEPTEDKPFTFSTFTPKVVNVMTVERNSGEPISGAIIALFATDQAGRPVVLGRARSLQNGTARFRVVVSPVTTELRIVSLHADYQLARQVQLAGDIGAGPIKVSMVAR